MIITAMPIARMPPTVNIHVPYEPVFGRVKPLVFTTVRGTTALAELPSASISTFLLFTLADAVSSGL